MASRAEVAEALRAVAAVFPTMEVTSEMASVWYEILNSLKGDVLMKATQDVLAGWDSTFPPPPGRIKNMALTGLRSTPGNVIPMHQSDLGQRQQAQALIANVAAAISSDDLSKDGLRARGKRGEVYNRIREGARKAGTAVLPAWSPSDHNPNPQL